jgi:hypothetical protein
MIVMLVKRKGGLLSPVAFDGHVWQFKIMMCLLVLLSPLASAANHEKTVAVEEPQPAAPLQLQKDLAGEVLLQAMSLTGIAYRFGGQSPATGFDCSGLIRFVFLKSVGYELPRTAAEQARQGRAWVWVNCRLAISCSSIHGDSGFRIAASIWAKASSSMPPSG